MISLYEFGAFLVAAVTIAMLPNPAVAVMGLIYFLACRSSVDNVGFWAYTLVYFILWILRGFRPNVPHR